VLEGSVRLAEHQVRLGQVAACPVVARVVVKLPLGALHHLTEGLLGLGIVAQPLVQRGQVDQRVGRVRCDLVRPLVSVQRGIEPPLPPVQPAQRAVVGFALGVGQAWVAGQRLLQPGLGLLPGTLALGFLAGRIQPVPLAAQGQPQRGNRRGELRLFFQGALQMGDGQRDLLALGVEIAEQVVGGVIGLVNGQGALQRGDGCVVVVSADLLLGQQLQREHGHLVLDCRL